jgi:hypothetical protein
VENLKKVTDEEVLAAYRKTKNIWAAGKIVGLAGQAVHDRLVKLGEPRTHPLFAREEADVLSSKYVLYRNAGKLDDLAKQMGRTKQFLCRQARKLGLTDKGRKAPWTAKWDTLSREDAAVMFDAFKASSLGFNSYCEKNGIPKSGFYKAMKMFFADEWDSVIELKAPKQSFYRLGRSVEYAVRDAFRALGYFVFRSPQSRGPADLVAIDKGVVVFVQCKRGMTIGVDEWNDFYDLCLSVDAVPIVVGRPTGRGLVYWLITGRKDGSRKAQPKADVRIDDIGRFSVRSGSIEDRFKEAER